MRIHELAGGAARPVGCGRPAAPPARGPSHLPWAPLAATLAALTATACAASWPAFDPSTAPDATARPDDHAVILLREAVATYEVDPDRGEPVLDTRHHLRVKVLTPEGARRWASYAIGHSRELSRLSDVRARVLRPDGTAAPPARVIDRPHYPDWMVFSDTRARVISFPHLAPGDVIDLLWRRRDAVLFVPHAFRLSARDPALVARVVLRELPGQVVARRTTRDGQDAPIPAEARTDPDGTRVTTWTLHDVPPPYNRGPYLPPTHSRGPIVTIALRSLDHAGTTQRFFTTWEDFGPWYAALTAGTHTPTERVSTFAHEALASALPDDPLDITRRFYHLVQRRVRYAAVAIGLGGWRPRPADHVAETALGDCKDKATLLKSLLVTAGVDSDLVIQGTRDVHAARFSEPNLAAMNHAILAVHLPGRDPLFLDPTCRACAFGKLPWTGEDTDVLIMSPAAARVARTPASAAADNAELWRYDVHLDPSGDADLSVTLRRTGHTATRSRSALFDMNLRERDAWSRRQVANRGHVSVTALDLIDADDVDAPLTFRADARVARLLGGSGPLRTLAVADLDSAAPALVPADRPPLPLHLAYPHTTHLEATVAVPPGVEATLPDDVHLATPHGSYRRIIRLANSRLHIDREYTLDALIVPADEVAAFTAFALAVRAAEEQPVVFRLAPPLATATPGGPP